MSSAPPVSTGTILGRISTVAAIGIVVGVIASLAAILFVEAVRLLNDLLLISPRSRMMADHALLLTLATILVPTLGGLVVGLLCQLIPERRPHGPPDAILAVQQAETAAGITTKSGLLTALASVIALGSGASVGQYGPLAHLGATLGCLVTKLGERARTLGAIGIACGAAAAISTAFNAPIAGIVFAHEVLLRHYSLRVFAPVTVAATIGFIIANVVFERPPLFRIESASVLYTWEFLVFALIGVLGALVAVVFMRSLLLANRCAAGLTIPAYTKPALAGLVLGLTALWIPDVLGIGKETLRFAIIEDAFEITELSLILIAKIALTALCLGFGFAGGVFSPSLLIGVLFGALVGSGIELLVGADRSAIAIYAICGMVAVTGSVIGAPLTTILIVFELTRNYDLTTAAMISVVFANLVSYRVFGRSLFDVQLSKRGFDLSLGRDKLILDSRHIVDYMTQEFTAITAEQTLAEAQAALLASHRNEAYVVDAEGHYLGTLTLGEILGLIEDGVSADHEVASLASFEHLVLHQNTSVWQAMERMGDFVGESIPVIAAVDDSRLVGVVFEAAIVKAYLDIAYTIRREEHASG